MGLIAVVAVICPLNALELEPGRKQWLCFKFIDLLSPHRLVSNQQNVQLQLRETKHRVFLFFFFPFSLSWCALEKFDHEQEIDCQDGCMQLY